MKEVIAGVSFTLILALNTGCMGLGAMDSYGAAAYAPSTQDWRFRWRAADPHRARQRVLEDCAAADCRVVLEFGPDQCGTLALGQGGLGVGRGDTPAAAEAAALAECQRAGSDCRVAAAECNR